MFLSNPSCYLFYVLVFCAKEESLSATCLEYTLHDEQNHASWGAETPNQTR